MTGLGDLVPGTSSVGRVGDGSSLGSLAGLLTLWRRREWVSPLPLTFEERFLFFFLLLPSPSSDLRFVPFGVA